MRPVRFLSRDFSQTVSIRKDERGVQHYSFQVPCDSQGTVVSWAMHDDAQLALKSAGDIVQHHKVELAAKIREMNRQLNEEIPYFRCPDDKMVDIYYYLWSLYLMYYIDVSKGWEMENHTQTAVNNFLGIHRYDAAFQIKVGAWISDKARYAYGNVLTLNHFTNYNYHAEWQILIAPEAYRRNLTLFGDQYSNFNAGKILLYLEGLAGLKLSIPDQQLTIRPALPKAWDWVEVRLPISGQWTRIRYAHDEAVRVSNCPYPVVQ